MCRRRMHNAPSSPSGPRIPALFGAKISGASRCKVRGPTEHHWGNGTISFPPHVGVSCALLFYVSGRCFPRNARRGHRNLTGQDNTALAAVLHATESAWLGGNKCAAGPLHDAARVLLWRGQCYATQAVGRGQVAVPRFLPPKQSYS